LESTHDEDDSIFALSFHGASKSLKEDGELDPYGGCLRKEVEQSVFVSLIYSPIERVIRGKSGTKYGRTILLNSCARKFTP
jgi:hypothetical protein